MGNGIFCFFLEATIPPLLVSLFRHKFPLFATLHLLRKPWKNQEKCQVLPLKKLYNALICSGFCGIIYGLLKASTKGNFQAEPKASPPKITPPDLLRNLFQKQKFLPNLPALIGRPRL